MPFNSIGWWVSYSTKLRMRKYKLIHINTFNNIILLNRPIATSSSQITEIVKCICVLASQTFFFFFLLRLLWLLKQTHTSSEHFFFLITYYGVNINFSLWNLPPWLTWSGLTEFSISASFLVVFLKIAEKWKRA